jgi:hypothetical protein
MVFKLVNRAYNRAILSPLQTGNRSKDHHLRNQAALLHNSAPMDGMQLFNILTTWFQASGIPYVEMKQETYNAMIRAGNPAIVPPTIEQVEFLTAPVSQPVPFAAVYDRYGSKSFGIAFAARVPDREQYTRGLLGFFQRGSKRIS